MVQAKTLHLSIGLSLLGAAVYAIIHLYLLAQSTPLTAIAPTLYIQIGSTFLLLALVLTPVFYNGIALLHKQ